MDTSRAVWRNLVLPSRASEEAGSRAGKKGDPSGDGVQEKQYKAHAKAAIKTFQPPASAMRQDSSRSLAPVSARSTEVVLPRNNVQQAIPTRIEEEIFAHNRQQDPYPAKPGTIRNRRQKRPLRGASPRHKKLAGRWTANKPWPG